MAATPSGSAAPRQSAARALGDSTIWRSFREMLSTAEWCKRSLMHDERSLMRFKPSVITEE
eukprot:1464327-Pleurochrysis_carterae.AAC.1